MLVRRTPMTDQNANPVPEVWPPAESVVNGPPLLRDYRARSPDRWQGRQAAAGTALRVTPVLLQTEQVVQRSQATQQVKQRNRLRAHAALAMADLAGEQQQQGLQEVQPDEEAGIDWETE